MGLKPAAEIRAMRESKAYQDYLGERPPWDHPALSVDDALALYYGGPDPLNYIRNPKVKN